MITLYYQLGDIDVKDKNKVAVFVLDDRLIEDDETIEVGAPLVIRYIDGDTDTYDNVISVDQTDYGFWVETETLNFRFDNHFEDSDDEDSLDWHHDSDEYTSGSKLFDEFEF